MSRMDIDRRIFSLLGASAFAVWASASRAQESGRPLVGLMSGGSSDQESEAVQAFQNGLNETGFIAGKNLRIEYFWAEGQNNRFSAFVTDLVRRRADVIVSLGSTPAAQAAKAATHDIPIVFMVGIDPVEAGLVATLARPGGNVTGVTNSNTELAPKRLELIRELLPNAGTIALLVNPASPLIAQTATRDLKARARDLGLQLPVMNASSEADFESVFSELAAMKASGLVIAPDAFFISRRAELAKAALKHAIPTVAQFREFAEAGGLMTYGSSRGELARLAGVYVGRVLAGEKPSDLPIQQTMKAELIINLRTAKALGLEIPPALLVRASDVIE